MTNTRVDIDKSTRLEVRGRLLYCIQTRKWSGIRIAVVPVERVRLGTNGGLALTRWVLSALLVFGVSAASYGLWSILEFEGLVVFTLLGCQVGMPTVFPSVVADVKAWYLRSNRVRLVLDDGVGPVSVLYRVGSDPEMDVLIERIRHNEDDQLSVSPASVQFSYTSTRGELVGYLIDLLPFSVFGIIVFNLWSSSSVYTLLMVFSAWIAVMYGPRLLAILWRIMATRRIRNAEAAMFDGEFDTAQLLLSALVEPALRGPYAANLQVTLALVRGDLNAAADFLAVLQRSFTYQVVFGTTYFGLRLRPRPAPTPNPEVVRKLAAYNGIQNSSASHASNVTVCESR
jgi:hypothetical protein